MTTTRAALAVIRNAARGPRVRAGLPADRDDVTCREKCFDESRCDGRGCFVTGLVRQSARARAVLGRRGLNPVAVYLERTVKKRGT